MAATVSASYNDKGVFRAIVTVLTTATPGTVYVGHLRNATIQTRRSAGAGADTLAVTGSNDGSNFAAVTSTTQVAGADVALSALTATAAVNSIRQNVEYLRFTVSGNTDTFEIIVSGTTRN